MASATISRAQLETELRSLVAVCDFSTITVKDIRKQLEAKLGVDLKPQKEEIKDFITALVQERQAAEEEEADSDLEFDASPSPAKKKTEDTFKWNMSPALMEFLGVSVSEMPFKEAQTLVQDYVRALARDPSDGRKYVCDDKLYKLFGVKKIAMFGIGKHLKKHIKKWVDVVEAEESEEEEASKKSAGKKRAASGDKAKPAAKKTKSKAVGKTKAGGKSKAGDEEKKARKPGGFACMPYRLSPIMARVTGETELPRPQVVKKIWEYIHLHGLQNPGNKSEILCDGALSELFGQEKVTMFSMNKYISQHLTKIEA